MKSWSSILVTVTLSALAVTNGQRVVQKAEYNNLNHGELPSLTLQETPIRTRHLRRSLLSLPDLVRKARIHELGIETRFEVTKHIYSKSRNALLLTHQEQVAAAYEVRDKELAIVESLCDSAKSRKEIDQCEEEKAKMEAIHKEALAEMASKVNEELTRSSKRYERDLAKVDILALKKLHILSHYLISIDEFAGAPLEMKIEAKGKIELALDAIEEMRDEIASEEQESICTLFKGLYIEFFGATGQVPEDQLDETSEHLELALNLAFAQEAIDIKVQKVRIVSQQFEKITGEYKQNTGGGKRRLGAQRHRQLRRRNTVLKMETIMGIECNCATDTIKSDVYGRRTLLDSAELATNPSFVAAYESVMENFAITVKELVGGVLADVNAVRTFKSETVILESTEDKGEKTTDNAKPTKTKEKSNKNIVLLQTKLGDLPSKSYAPITLTYKKEQKTVVESLSEESVSEESNSAESPQKGRGKGKGK